MQLLANNITFYHNFISRLKNIRNLKNIQILEE